MAEEGVVMSRIARKCADIGRILVKEEAKEQIKKVTCILKKSEVDRTEYENMLLLQSPEIVEGIVRRCRSREVAKQRQLEVEDSASVLHEKCDALAAAIKQAHHFVVYTGAGISTAASIPDYRGPNGVWTRLLQGKTTGTLDLSCAVPTYTHMSLLKLHSQGLLRHVVSQNCDGLHLRSGLCRNVLSEVHGNMYIELCSSCVSPASEYIRLFDVTERTGVHRHNTGRKCERCASTLRDSIVHFGERGMMTTPYNWHEASAASSDADVILCLGTSLKVLKKYRCLWAMHKPAAERPKLFIVNLQWTPKDDMATMKINGKCDDVMQLVMKALQLEVEPYTRDLDPIFAIAKPLTTEEETTTSRRQLIPPSEDNIAELRLRLASNTEIVDCSRQRVRCKRKANTARKQGSKASGNSSDRGCRCQKRTEKNSSIHLETHEDLESPSISKRRPKLPSRSGGDMVQGDRDPQDFTALNAILHDHGVLLATDSINTLQEGSATGDWLSSNATPSDISTESDACSLSSQECVDAIPDALQYSASDAQGRCLPHKLSSFADDTIHQPTDEIGTATTESTELSCNNSVPTSVDSAEQTPGWFGKGLNVRKLKRKKSK